MRRPLNALFFAFRLKITAYNFWHTMILQTGLCAFSLFLYLKTLHRSLGTLSTLASLAFIFYYAQMFVHSTLSEELGLTLGLCGFVLLWNGWFQRNRAIFNRGMATLSLALSVRAGPNFMGFALLALLFLKPFTGSRFKDLSLSLPALILPSIMVAGYASFFIDPANPGMALGNFSSTLYGLVNGGKTWNYAYEDPQIQGLVAGKPEGELARILYAHCWKAFKDNPFNLIRGMLNNLKELVYTFTVKLAFGSGYVKTLMVYIISIFWVLMGIRIYRKRLQFHQEYTFLAFIFLSIIASASVIFVDGGIRPFAVAIPFIGALLVWLLPPHHPLSGQ